MTTVDFITELFCRVDDQIGYLPNQPSAFVPQRGGDTGLAACADGQRSVELLALTEARLPVAVSQLA
jgi:hypothetical protein